MNNIISSVSEFIFVKDDPVNSDIILVVGGSLPEAAETAADLYRAGYAPLVFIGGKYSIKSRHFPGAQSKTDIYNKNYETEYDFYKDVLLRNGVQEHAIIGEKESMFTRQNAEYAKAELKKRNIPTNRILLICKSFHARRCLMFYQASFPDSDIRIIPFNGFGISKENWFLTDYGIERVLGELSRCGSQFGKSDIENYIK